MNRHIRTADDLERSPSHRKQHAHANALREGACRPPRIRGDARGADVWHGRAPGVESIVDRAERHESIPTPLLKARLLLAGAGDVALRGVGRRRERLSTRRAGRARSRAVDDPRRRSSIVFPRWARRAHPRLLRARGSGRGDAIVPEGLRRNLAFGGIAGFRCRRRRRGASSCGRADSAPGDACAPRTARVVLRGIAAAGTALQGPVLPHGRLEVATGPTRHCVPCPGALIGPRPGRRRSALDARHLGTCHPGFPSAP
mgnify:CR=1 FL=1